MSLSGVIGDHKSRRLAASVMPWMASTMRMTGPISAACSSIRATTMPTVSATSLSRDTVSVGRRSDFSAITPPA